MQKQIIVYQEKREYPEDASVFICMAENESVSIFNVDCDFINRLSVFASSIIEII
jgi:hypothetical protein